MLVFLHVGLNAELQTFVIMFAFGIDLYLNVQPVELRSKPM